MRLSGPYLSRTALGCMKEQILRPQVCGTQLDEIRLLAHFISRFGFSTGDKPKM